MAFCYWGCCLPAKSPVPLPVADETMCDKKKTKEKNKGGGEEGTQISHMCNVRPLNNTIDCQLQREGLEHKKARSIFLATFVKVLACKPRSSILESQDHPTQAFQLS